ncbi:hypothetical protein ES319_1Z031400v1 [Gossypium barbadense]|uniref:Sec-independent protein translocase protein TATC, chloroplastic n=2 Tax=Gossypium barbadense TaxID=3634 RepID=A0A5J5NEU9_GOSBA|nr:hypothetical protein ES319_1Z031400v1 [Gossypium barbadense]
MRILQEMNFFHTLFLDVANISPEEAPFEQNNEGSSLYNFLYPDKDLLPDDKEMTIFDHLEELRQRIFVSVLAVGAAILGCFAFSKELIVFLEAPVKAQGVRFLQLAPGEFFFTTLKVSGYCGLLLGSPVILYEIIAFVLPGLTRAERRFLGPIVLGSSVLFYAGIAFSYLVLTPAALNFFVSYAEGVVESLWSIDQYFELVLVLMFSTGLSFQKLTSKLRWLHVIYPAGSRHTISSWTTWSCFGGSDAFHLEVCSGWCSCCSSCTYTINGSSYTDASGSTTFGTLLRRCMGC